MLNDVEKLFFKYEKVKELNDTRKLKTLFIYSTHGKHPLISHRFCKELILVVN